MATMPSKRPTQESGMMKNESAERGPGRLSVPAGEARRIAKRLRARIVDRDGSVYAFAKRTRLPPSTVQAWTRTTKPAVPDPARLLVLARDLGISLDYLLLGEGPELRGAPAPRGVLAEDLRKWLIVELTARGIGDSGELDRMVPAGDSILRTLLIDQQSSVGHLRTVVLKRAKELLKLRSQAKGGTRRVEKRILPLMALHGKTQLPRRS